MTIVPVIGELVAFVALNEEILPFPVAPKLMDVFVFVQLNAVPVTVPLKLSAEVGALLQTTWSAGFTTVGIGLTVMLNDCGEPEHVTPELVMDGVTETVPDIGVFTVFVVVNAAIFDVPLAPRLIAVLEFVQAYEVPATLNVLLKFTAAVGEPTQTV